MEIRTGQDSLAGRYADMRNTFGRSLRSGAHRVGRPPRDGELSWGVSLVIKLTGPLAQKLADLGDSCRRAARGTALAYQVDQLHITVRSIEGYREEPLSAPRRDEICRYVADSIAEVSPFQIQLSGLSGGGDTLFVCGYSEPGLAQMRHALHGRRRELPAAGPRSPDFSRIRDTSHASLLLFRQQAEAEPDIPRILDDHSDVNFGVESVQELVLMEYSPTASSVGMTALASFPLR